MKKITYLTSLIITSFSLNSFAGFRFNTPIYVCSPSLTPSEGPQLSGGELTISIATPENGDEKADLQGQWSIDGLFYDLSGAYISIYGSGYENRSFWNSAITNVEYGPAWIGEEPISYELSLNTETLMGEIIYKKWNGYSSFGSPNFQLTTDLSCNPVR